MHNILYIAQYAHYLNVAQYDNSNDDDAIGRQLHKRNRGFFRYFVHELQERKKIHIFMSKVKHHVVGK